MADCDLEALSLCKLMKMRKDVAKAISTYKDRQTAKARAKVDAFAQNLGYSLAELVGTEPKSSRAPAAAKYRLPEDTALTWSGRGPKPQWFVDALAAGKSKDDLAIGLGGAAMHAAQSCRATYRRRRSIFPPIINATFLEKQSGFA